MHSQFTLHTSTLSRWLCGILFCGFCLLAALPVAANSIHTVDVSHFNNHLTLNKNLVYQEDSNSDMTIDTVMALRNSDAWNASDSDIPNLGLGIKPHWFAIRLANDSDNTINSLLNMPYTMLDFLDVYFVQGEQIQMAAQVGDQRPFSQRALANRSFLIPIQIKAHENTLIFLRAESFGALKLPLEMWSLKEFLKYDQQTLAPQLAFVGMMLALAIYNLFLLLATRDWNYLWYVVCMISISFVIMSFHGILAQYAWPELPQLNNPILVASISVNIFAATLFAYTFLNLGRFKWPVRALFLGHSVAGAIIFILNLFLPYVVTIKLVALFSVTGATTGIITGIYLWYRGEILARFYTISWFLLLTGSVTITFSHFGWLPSIVLFDYGQQIGAATEGLLLSFALAYRINMEKQKRFHAQAQLLKLQMQANQELESRVDDRTAALAEANQKLLKISLTDGLTEIYNRKFFDQKLQSEWQTNAREPAILCLLMIDGDHFKTINDSYGHLCGDALLKHLARIFQSVVQRTGDFVCRYGGEEFAIVLCNTPLAGAADLAERVREKVETSPLDWQGKALTMTISIGVAGAQPNTENEPSALISAADKALYAAKKAGRNRVIVNLDKNAEQGESRLVSLEELNIQKTNMP